MRRISARGQEGQTIVIVAFALPVLLLVAALLIDVTGLFVHKRSLQNRADSVSLAASQDLDHMTGTCAGNCVTVLNAYNKKNDPEAADLVPCTVSTSTNCYAAPYVDGSGHPHIGQIEVRLKDTANLVLGGIAGIVSQDVSARSVAGATYSFLTNTTTTPGTTVVTTIPGTPPSGGSPALAFSKSTDACSAGMHLSGSSNTFSGAIVSNSGVDSSNSNTGPLLIYGNQIDTAKCLKLHGGDGWDEIKSQAPGDWPVQPPTCTPACNIATANAKLIVTSVGGVPCVDEGDKFTVTTQLAPGLYCARTSITVNKSGLISHDVGFVAPSIGFSSGTGNLTGYSGLLSQYGGLLFYAYDDHGFNESGSSNTISGAIFAPFGNAQVSGSNGSTVTGFIEGDTVQISGSNATWFGLGPEFDQDPGTPDQVITTTTPATVTTTTTPGPTSYGLDE